MGGGYYDRDVESYYTGGSFDYGDYSNAADEAMEQRQVHGDVLPLDRTLVCRNKNPIVVAMDVTRSRGNDSKIIYDKMPMLFGQIKIQGYLPDPAVSFAAIGDATSGDLAPIQVADFATGEKLDDWLTKLWLEEGGGGTGRESYELMAYYYARQCQLPKADGKGILFFTGDEGFYPTVSGAQIREHITGRRRDIDAAKVFAELQRKFHVFFIYPKKQHSERRADIDAEIAARVTREGGQMSGDIRASLIWHNRNDLDLHVVAPSGEHIYFGNKRARCGGELDVDMNVRGESLEPVENIYWPRNKAPHGRYKVYVENYAYHGGNTGDTKFKVELMINGEVEHFTGSVRGTSTSSRKVVKTFDYSGPGRRELAGASVYAAYDDATILDQWARVIPREHILILEEPKAIVDTMLGAVALVSETRDLDAYLVDMKDRGQSRKRIANVKKTLAQLGEVTALQKVEIDKPTVSGGRKRRARSRRLG